MLIRGQFNGIWAILLIGKWSMVVGWCHLIKDLFNKKPVNDEFVSYNARRVSEPDPSYEMLGSRKTGNSINSETPSTLPGMLRISSTTNQSTLPKSYLPSRSSMLSLSPASPETDTNSPSGNNIQFSPFAYKAEAVSESEEEFHHGLSPKPPSASYRNR